ncbi:MAG: segregation/condensation protein A [Clostridiales bacterium]|nr:segregation/condensation protein A [Clostridiales bacterium]
MDDPIFHLTGIVRSKGEMEDFVGPLSLILQLLSKNKIEIRDLSISLILEQYLEYLDNLKRMDLEIASEFVAMASYLMLIKTKMLLSAGEEVTELDQLISSLEELKRRDSYARIKAVVETLRDMSERAGVTYTKPPEYIPPDNTYRYTHKIADLLRAYRRIARGEEPSQPAGKPFTYPRPIVYSVRDKAQEILQKLSLEGAAQMSALVKAAGSRSEIVAIFIAVLELCRVGEIEFIETQGDVTIYRAVAPLDLPVPPDMPEEGTGGDVSNGNE